MRDIRVIEQELYAAMRAFQRLAPDGASPRLQAAHDAVFLAQQELQRALLRPEARRAA